MSERLKKLPLAAWIVIGLVLGVALGLALPAAGKAPWSDALVAGADVIAKLWLAALQMTILPLVFALLSTTFVRSAKLGESRGIARRTIVILLALYLLAIVVGLVFTPILLALSPVTPAVAAAMRGGGPVEVAHLPVTEMLLGMVPSNIVSAAASGSLLPVVVFALVLGAALAKIGAERNAALVAALEGLAAAMFVVVGWVTAIPSTRSGPLVPDFAQRLATALGLPFQPTLERVRESPPQREMDNSVQQVANVRGAFAVTHAPPPGGWCSPNAWARSACLHRPAACAG